MCQATSEPKCPHGLAAIPNGNGRTEGAAITRMADPSVPTSVAFRTLHITEAQNRAARTHVREGMGGAAEKKSQPAHRHPSAPPIQELLSPRPPRHVHPLVDLQRLAGNQAVQRAAARAWRTEPGRRDADYRPRGADGTGSATRSGDPRSDERRFRHDFGRVRVHADSRAAESARSVLARAYTVGPHIVFGDGQYGRDAPGQRTSGPRTRSHSPAGRCREYAAVGGLGRRLRAKR